MTKEDIALQLTLKTIDRISFKTIAEAKTLPYELYNSFYENIKTSDDKAFVALS